MDKIEIGKRMREYLINKYGKLNVGAERLNMSPQNLNKYLKGEFLPGAEIISKLGESGCDINWLLNIDMKDADKISEPANDYSVKDKIILSQTEEIFLLKKQLLDLIIKLDILEKESIGFEKSLKVNEDNKNKNTNITKRKK